MKKTKTHEDFNFILVHFLCLFFSELNALMRKVLVEAQNSRNHIMPMNMSCMICMQRNRSDVKCINAFFALHDFKISILALRRASRTGLLQLQLDIRFQWRNRNKYEFYSIIIFNIADTFTFEMQCGSEIREQKRIKVNRLLFCFFFLLLLLLFHFELCNYKPIRMYLYKSWVWFVRKREIEIESNQIVRYGSLNERKLHRKRKTVLQLDGLYTYWIIWTARSVHKSREREITNDYYYYHATCE